MECINDIIPDDLDTLNPPKSPVETNDRIVVSVSDPTNLTGEIVAVPEDIAKELNEVGDEYMKHVYMPLMTGPFTQYSIRKQQIHVENQKDSDSGSSSMKEGSDESFLSDAAELVDDGTESHNEVENLVKKVLITEPTKFYVPPTNNESALRAYRSSMGITADDDKKDGKDKRTTDDFNKPTGILGRVRMIVEDERKTEEAVQVIPSGYNKIKPIELSRFMPEDMMESVVSKEFPLTSKIRGEIDGGEHSDFKNIPQYNNISFVFRPSSFAAIPKSCLPQNLDGFPCEKFRVSVALYKVSENKMSIRKLSKEHTWILDARDELVPAVEFTYSPQVLVGSGVSMSVSKLVLLVIVYVPLIQTDQKVSALFQPSVSTEEGESLSTKEKDRIRETYLKKQKKFQDQKEQTADFLYDLWTPGIWSFIPISDRTMGQYMTTNEHNNVVLPPWLKVSKERSSKKDGDFPVAAPPTSSYFQYNLIRFFKLPEVMYEKDEKDTAASGSLFSSGSGNYQFTYVSNNIERTLLNIISQEFLKPQSTKLPDYAKRNSLSATLSFRARASGPFIQFPSGGSRPKSGPGSESESSRYGVHDNKAKSDRPQLVKVGFTTQVNEELRPIVGKNLLYEYIRGDRSSSASLQHHEMYPKIKEMKGSVINWMKKNGVTIDSLNMNTYGRVKEITLKLNEFLGMKSGSGRSQSRSKKTALNSLGSDNIKEGLGVIDTQSKKVAESAASAGCVNGEQEGAKRQSTGTSEKEEDDQGIQTQQKRQGSQADDTDARGEGKAEVSAGEFSISVRDAPPPNKVSAETNNRNDQQNQPSGGEKKVKGSSRRRHKNYQAISPAMNTVFTESPSTCSIIAESEFNQTIPSVGFSNTMIFDIIASNHSRSNSSARNIVCFVQLMRQERRETSSGTTFTNVILDGIINNVYGADLYNQETKAMFKRIVKSGIEYHVKSPCLNLHLSAQLPVSVDFTYHFLLTFCHVSIQDKIRQKSKQKDEESAKKEEERKNEIIRRNNDKQKYFETLVNEMNKELVGKTKDKPGNTKEQAIPSKPFLDDLNPYNKIGNAIVPVFRNLFDFDSPFEKRGTKKGEAEEDKVLETDEHLVFNTLENRGIRIFGPNELRPGYMYEFFNDQKKAEAYGFVNPLNKFRQSVRLSSTKADGSSGGGYYDRGSGDPNSARLRPIPSLDSCLGILKRSPNTQPVIETNKCGGDYVIVNLLSNSTLFTDNEYFVRLKDRYIRLLELISIKIEEFKGDDLLTIAKPKLPNRQTELRDHFSEVFHYKDIIDRLPVADVGGPSKEFVTKLFLILTLLIKCLILEYGICKKARGEAVLLGEEKVKQFLEFVYSSKGPSQSKEEVGNVFNNLFGVQESVVSMSYVKNCRDCIHAIVTFVDIQREREINWAKVKTEDTINLCKQHILTDSFDQQITGCGFSNATPQTGKGQQLMQYPSYRSSLQSGPFSFSSLTGSFKAKNGKAECPPPMNLIHWLLSYGITPMKDDILLGNRRNFDNMTTEYVDNIFSPELFEHELSILRSISLPKTKAKGESRVKAYGTQEEQDGEVTTVGESQQVSLPLILLETILSTVLSTDVNARLDSISIFRGALPFLFDLVVRSMLVSPSLTSSIPQYEAFHGATVRTTALLSLFAFIVGALLGHEAKSGTQRSGILAATSSKFVTNLKHFELINIKQYWVINEFLFEGLIPGLAMSDSRRAIMDSLRKHVMGCMDLRCDVSRSNVNDDTLTLVLNMFGVMLEGTNLYEDELSEKNCETNSDADFGGVATLIDIILNATEKMINNPVCRSKGLALLGYVISKLDSEYRKHQETRLCMGRRTESYNVILNKFGGFITMLKQNWGTYAGWVTTESLSNLNTASLQIVNVNGDIGSQMERLSGCLKKSGDDCLEALQALPPSGKAGSHLVPQASEIALRHLQSVGGRKSESLLTARAGIRRSGLDVYAIPSASARGQSITIPSASGEQSASRNPFIGKYLGQVKSARRGFEGSQISVLQRSEEIVENESPAKLFLDSIGQELMGKFKESFVPFCQKFSLMFMYEYIYSNIYSNRSSRITTDTLTSDESSVVPVTEAASGSSDIVVASVSNAAAYGGATKTYLKKSDSANSITVLPTQPPPELVIPKAVSEMGSPRQSKTIQRQMFMSGRRLNYLELINNILEFNNFDCFYLSNLSKLLAIIQNYNCDIIRLSRKSEAIDAFKAKAEGKYAANNAIGDDPSMMIVNYDLATFMNYFLPSETKNTKPSDTYGIIAAASYEHINALYTEYILTSNAITNSVFLEDFKNNPIEVLASQSNFMTVLEYIGRILSYRYVLVDTYKNNTLDNLFLIIGFICFSYNMGECVPQLLYPGDELQVPIQRPLVNQDAVMSLLRSINSLLCFKKNVPKAPGSGKKGTSKRSSKTLSTPNVTDTNVVTNAGVGADEGGRLLGAMEGENATTTETAQTQEGTKEAKSKDDANSDAKQQQKQSCATGDNKTKTKQKSNKSDTHRFKSLDNELFSKAFGISDQNDDVLIYLSVEIVSILVYLLMKYNSLTMMNSSPVAITTTGKGRNTSMDDLFILNNNTVFSSIERSIVMMVSAASKDQPAKVNISSLLKMLIRVKTIATEYPTNIPLVGLPDAVFESNNQRVAKIIPSFIDKFTSFLQIITKIKLETLANLSLTQANGQSSKLKRTTERDYYPMSLDLLKLASSPNSFYGILLDLEASIRDRGIEMGSAECAIILLVRLILVCSENDPTPLVDPITGKPSKRQASAKLNDDQCAPSGVTSARAGSGVVDGGGVSQRASIDYRTLSYSEKLSQYSQRNQINPGDRWDTNGNRIKSGTTPLAADQTSIGGRLTTSGDANNNADNINEQCNTADDIVGPVQLSDFDRLGLMPILTSTKDESLRRLYLSNINDFASTLVDSAHKEDKDGDNVDQADREIGKLLLLDNSLFKNSRIFDLEAILEPQYTGPGSNGVVGHEEDTYARIVEDTRDCCRAQHSLMATVYPRVMKILDTKLPEEVKSFIRINFITEDEWREIKSMEPGETGCGGGRAGGRSMSSSGVGGVGGVGSGGMRSGSTKYVRRHDDSHLDRIIMMIQSIGQFLEKTNFVSWRILLKEITMDLCRSNLRFLPRCVDIAKEISKEYRILYKNCGQVPQRLREVHFYKVVFLGKRFEGLNGGEYVYRVPLTVQLGEFSSLIQKRFAKDGDVPVEIVKSCIEDDPDELECNEREGKVVKSIRQEMFESTSKRFIAIDTLTPMPTLRCCDSDTPFTEEVTRQNEEVNIFYCISKKKVNGECVSYMSVLNTELSMPTLIPEIKVSSRRVVKLSKIETCIFEIAGKANDIEKFMKVGELSNSLYRNEIELRADKKTSTPEPLWDKGILLGIIKGSIAAEVNGGLLPVCEEFLKPNDKKWSQTMKYCLKSELERFMIASKWALNLLIGPNRDSDTIDDLLKFLRDSYNKLGLELKSYGLYVSLMDKK